MCKQHTTESTPKGYSRYAIVHVSAIGKERRILRVAGCLGDRPETYAKARKIANEKKDPTLAWGLNFFLGCHQENFTHLVSYNSSKFIRGHINWNVADYNTATQRLQLLGNWIRSMFPEVHAIKSNFLASSARISEIMKYVDIDAATNAGIAIEKIKPVVLWLENGRGKACLLEKTSTVFVVTLGISINTEETEWMGAPLLCDISEEDAYQWIQRDNRLFDVVESVH